MAFVYHRTIHFPDTDAAGVVFFPNYLAICHAADEEARAAIGVNLRPFFAENTRIIPISQSSADYLRPLFCGDKIAVTVKPTRTTPDTFTLAFEMTRLDPTPTKTVAHVRTTHVCIRSDTRQRTPLPAPLATWIDANPV